MRIITFLCSLVFSFSTFAQQAVTDDFEGNGTITTWFADQSIMELGFINPFQNSSNNSSGVMKYEDTGQSFANVGFDIDDTFDLTTNHTFTLKIYVLSSEITGSENNQVSLKLQNGNLNQPFTTQTEIIRNIVLDQWQEITFDFSDSNQYINYSLSSGAPVNRTDFNRVLIQVNGENNSSKVVAYIDDFAYDGTIASSNNPVYDQLVWSDEFEGSGPIDSQKWYHQTLFPDQNLGSWFNNEIQHYTNRIDNSYRDNGVLKIVAKKENYTDQGVTKSYTSARLNSKFAFTYGKVEIRAKMPTGVGTFPALWTLGKNVNEYGGYWTSQSGEKVTWPACGEIDIIEHWGDNQDFVQSALHTPSSYANTVNKGGRTIVGASTQFHVYSMEWTEEKIIFKVDNIIHYTYNPAIKNDQTWPFDKDQYLLLNVAMLQDVQGFTESAMEVDYVRVYQQSTLSTKDFENEKQIAFYPNPVENQLNIKISPEYMGATIAVFNMLGKKIGVFKMNNDLKSIDFSDYSRGIYIVKFQLADRVYAKQIVKY